VRKQEEHNSKIPAFWAADVRRVREQAITPRSPEDHRQLQQIEGQRRLAQGQGGIEHGG